MSNVALYEATRYALAVHYGVVQEVYEVLEWHPAWTTPYETRTRRQGVSIEGRVGVYR